MVSGQESHSALLTLHSGWNMEIYNMFQEGVFLAVAGTLTHMYSTETKAAEQHNVK